MLKKIGSFRSHFISVETLDKLKASSTPVEKNDNNSATEPSTIRSEYKHHTIVYRVAESTEEVSKIRPPRLIREDGIIRPFNQGDAEGYDLFQRSEIKKLEGELFREHCKVPGSRKTSLVVTNRRVMCLKEIDFVDHINKDWECLFENFTRPPSLQGSSLNIYTKDQGIKMFQNKDSQDSMREVPLQNPDIARKMCSAIDEAKTSRQQHQLVKQKSRRFMKQNTLP